ncbi:hypothetical protein GCM10009840_12650 [Pseudolysinimonas kribbensis]|uniref:DUF4190 domain-containing protein n=1 Tax=Pseudolysinimonas kribbensis TaxID=433641 RepID=A0ABQ6K507_9MICO|nr:hypothetical protein [Pseudolysinimonas kribbensis]GMA95715.1 hypothetical protein GCM10025881_25390 [Pseudolysinimonas kribbensis]
MSDATPPPPTPEQPATPAAPAAPAYAPGTPVKQGLSLTGFILGIAAVVFSWVFIFGLLVAIAGLIISLIARGREPQAPNWMKLIGLILSIVGLVIAALVLIFTIIGLVALASVGNLNSY